MNSRINLQTKLNFFLDSRSKLRRWTRKYIFNIFNALFLLSIIGTCSSLKAEECSSCDTAPGDGRGVPVSFNGAFLSGDYLGAIFSVDIVGEASSGVEPNDSTCTTLNSVPTARTYLKPDRTYFVRAFRLFCAVRVNFDIPPGYDLYINGQKRTSISELSPTGDPFYDHSWGIVLREKCQRCSGEAGENIPPVLGSLNNNNGSFYWGVKLGYLSDGRSAGGITVQEGSLSSSSYKATSLIYSPPAQTNQVDVVRVNNQGNVVGPQFISFSDSTWNSYQGILRQVKVPQALADIITVSDFEYEIRLYTPNNVGSKVNGLYTVSGQPFVSYRVRNPNAPATNELEISKTEGGALRDTSKFKWTQTSGFAGAWEDFKEYVGRKVGMSASANGENTAPLVSDGVWSLERGGGISNETRTTIINPLDSAETIETTERKNGSGQVSSRSQKVFRNFEWGKEVVRAISDPDGDALTTTYAYFQDSTEEGRYGKVQSKTSPDGSWEKYDYDQYGNLVKLLRPFKDLQLASADDGNSYQTVYEYTNNNGYELEGYPKILSRTDEYINNSWVKMNVYTRTNSVYNGHTVIVLSQDSYANSSGNSYLTTKTATYHHSAPEHLADRIAYVESPDGKKETYVYEKGNYTVDPDPSLNSFTPDVNGKAERTNVISGTIAAPMGIAYKTTKNTTVRDERGNVVLEEAYVFDGANYERIEWTVNSFDDTGHQLSAAKNTGEVSMTSWNGDLMSSRTEADGTRTEYAYDELQRLKTQTKKGIAASGGFPAQADIMTTYSYDAEGRKLSETKASGANSLTTSNTFDKSGRIKTSTDNAGQITNYSYSNGGRTERVTLPGGATRITDRYLDGETKSITGTSVVSKYYDYGVSGSSYGIKFTTEFTGDGGFSSPRWVKKKFDWLGRVIDLEKPAFTAPTLRQIISYNSKGQLTRERTTKGGSELTNLIADKRYQYDELGNLARMGLDVSSDEDLTVTSTDRISDTNSYYEKNNGDWFEVTVNKSYQRDNSPTFIAVYQKQRLTNFPKNGDEQTIAESITIDPAGNQNKNTTLINAALKKKTTVVDRADSINNEITIEINDLLQSAVPSEPQAATTYSYDSLGRETGISNPTSGLKNTAYENGTGRVLSISDNVGTVTYEYYPSTHPNAGRLKSETNPAGKKKYFEYNLRGQVTRNWGDNIYPTEFVYNSYGQKTDLRTFRSGSGWNGSSWSTTNGTADVTKWIFNEPTGLLVQKQDPASKGPTYTYDTLGRVATRQWARQVAGINLTTTYAYDNKTGDLAVVSYSDSTPSVFLIKNRAGQISSATDAAGEHKFSYNAVGALENQQTTVGLFAGLNTSVNYNTYFRRESTQARIGTTVIKNQNYSYDEHSRLKIVSAGGQTATYGYDSNTGLLRNTAFSGGTNISRTYDVLGEIESVTTAPANDAPTSYSYTYNNLHQRTRETREDNSYYVYTYNDRNEVVASKKYWSDGTPVAGMQNEYDYDNIGNRVSSKEGGNSAGNNLRTVTYSQNSLNQYEQRNVTGSIDIMGSAAADTIVTVNGQSTYRRGTFFQSTLSFNNASNPVVAQVDVVAAKNNAGAGGEDSVEQKTGKISVPKTPEIYTYDLDGNLTSDGLWSYTWDSENRLSSITSLPNLPNDAKKRLEFTYDHQGRRVQKKILIWNDLTNAYQQANLIKFIYDGWNLIGELDATNSVIKSYTWGTKELLFTHETNQTYQVSHNASENIIALINAGTGKRVAQYDYDVFGNCIQESGSYASKNPFRFGGHYTDAETGFVYYGYRYYNPQTGRWLSKDPIGETGGDNLYSFVNNSPSNFADELGMLPRSHWESLALNNINFNDRWEVNEVLMRNRKITAAYGRMFQRKPDVYVWCGLAAFASNLAGQSMAATASALSLTSIVDTIMSYDITFGETNASKVSKQTIFVLGKGNKVIYTDMMWQHLAYDSGGIEEMREANKRSELDPRLLEAWEDVNCGQEKNDPDLIFSGAAKMARYEQEVILQEVIRGYEKLMDATGGLAMSPIPGDDVTFKKFLPNGSFSNGADRANYAVDYLVPLWKQKLSSNPDEMMRLINDLISKGQ